MKNSAAALFMIAGSLVFVAGCGESGPDTYHVKGTVTYKGAPIPTGSITFTPAKGNTGPAGYADIKDGKFDTSGEGRNRGTVGGPHRVTIIGFDGKAKPDAELPLGNPLFPEYQVEKDLPKEDSAVVDFVVEPKRP